MILNALDQPAFLIDADGQIMLANDHYRRWNACDPVEVAGGDDLARWWGSAAQQPWQDALMELRRQPSVDAVEVTVGSASDGRRWTGHFSSLGDYALALVRPVDESERLRGE